MVSGPRPNRPAYFIPFPRPAPFTFAREWSGSLLRSCISPIRYAWFRSAPGALSESGEFSRDRQMAGPPGQFGLNGVAVTPNDEFVIAGFTSPSKLFVMKRGGGAVREISLHGDPFAPERDPHFMGADGIIFINEKLYVIHDGGVQEITFRGHGYGAGRVKNRIVREPGLSTATVAAGQLYVIKSEVVRMVHMHQPPRLPFKIYRVPGSLFD